MERPDSPNGPVRRSRTGPRPAIYAPVGALHLKQALGTLGGVRHRTERGSSRTRLIQNEAHPERGSPSRLASGEVEYRIGNLLRSAPGV